MIEAIVQIWNEAPDAVRFFAMEIPKYRELLALLADAAGMVLFEDGSIG